MKANQVSIRLLSAERPVAAVLHAIWRLRTALLMAGLLCCLLAPAVRAADDVLSQRRARVESMSAAEKERLKRNYERFMQLDSDQRQKLRTLHAKIAAEPDQHRLLAVMRAYHQWMQSLTAGERLQLLDLPAEQRVRAIKRLIERQERERFQAIVQKKISTEDRDAIFSWLSELVLQQLPFREQQRLRSIESPMRRRMEAMAVFRRRMGGMNDSRFVEWLKPSIADRDRLVASLSQEAQAALDALNDDQEKRKLIQSWITAAIYSRRGNRPDVSKEALEAFFAQLEPAEKEYLNNLPPDRKQAQLEYLYMRSRLPRPRDGRGPFGTPPRRRLD